MYTYNSKIIAVINYMYMYIGSQTNNWPNILIKLHHNYSVHVLLIQSVKKFLKTDIKDSEGDVDMTNV